MVSPDISVIITAHREGVIAGATARSALAALGATRSAGLSDEIILVLDRADAITAQVLCYGLDGQARVLETSEGDPGQARNRGIEAANGRCATFLDADDLWSENWLLEAWKMIENSPGRRGALGLQHHFRPRATHLVAREFRGRAVRSRLSELAELLGRNDLCENGSLSTISVSPKRS